MVCLDPTHPKIRPDRDRQYRFFLDEDVTVTLQNNNTHLIPKGYRFDGHSIPRIFWFWFPAFDADVYAALVHDWLIDTEMFWRYNRAFQDETYKTLMHDPQYFASRYRRLCFPIVVRLFGWLRFGLWGDFRGEIKSNQDYRHKLSSYT